MASDLFGCFEIGQGLPFSGFVSASIRNLTTVHCLFVAKQPDSSVLCLYDGTGVEPYNLRFRQPVPHRCLIVGFFVSVWIIREWSCCISGVSNVWSGLRRLRLPDQGLVSPALPVLLSESPSGRSAVPQTVLRLRTLLITSLVAGTGGKIEL
ncbi:hypothetical protein Bca101_097716 [Brassica carinata]